MPKLGLMAQISRPFQIALVALLAFAMLIVAWFMVLHRSTATESSGTSSPGVAASAGSSASHVATHAASSGAGSGHVYHGPVPGLEGLTRDVKRAHEAAGKEERGGAYDEQHAGATHGSTASASTGSPAKTHASTSSAASTSHTTTAVHTRHTTVIAHTHHTTATAHTHHTTATAHTHHTTATAHTHHTTVTAHTHHGATTARPHAQSHGSSAAAATAALTLHHLTEAVHLNAVVNLVEEIDPALGLRGKLAHAEGVVIARMKADLQPASPATIAAELHQGKVVLLLFLNPHAYDDDATAIGTTEVAYKLRHHVAAHLALASQVNSFGSITRDVQVYQTPTLLIINPKREVATVTGLTDEFSLEQAIAEAKG
jgi:hypothetical protein